MKQTAIFSLLAFSAALLIAVQTLALPLRSSTTVDIDREQNRYSAAKHGNGTEDSTWKSPAFMYHDVHWSTAGEASQPTDSTTHTNPKDLQPETRFFEYTPVPFVQINAYFLKKHAATESDASHSGSWSNAQKVYARNRLAPQDQLTVASIPESATMLLFGTGILGLVGIIRRQMQT